MMQGSAINIEASETGPLAGYQSDVLEHPYFQATIGSLFRPPLPFCNTLSQRALPLDTHRGLLLVQTALGPTVRREHELPVWQAI